MAAQLHYARMQVASSHVVLTARIVVGSCLCYSALIMSRESTLRNLSLLRSCDHFDELGLHVNGLGT